MFFKKKISVGIDIGNYSIKAAVMNARRNTIIDLVQKEILPERKYINDVIDEDRILSVCKDVLGDYINPNSRYDPEIFLSVQGEGVVCSYIEFPPLEKKQLEMAIQSTTVKYIPYPIGESVITYISVPPLNENDQSSKAFFFISINKSFIDKRTELIKKLGVFSKKSDAFIIPLIKSFTENHGKFQDEFRAIVNAGSSYTSVIIIKNGFPYFARDFSIGGSDFTYAFQMASQSSWKEAEDYKLNYDFTHKEHSVESIFLRWLEQIRKSINAFTRLDRKLNLTVSKILLTGGSAQLNNLDKRLEESLNIPVVKDEWNLLKPKSRNIDSFAGSFNIALGLNM